MCKYFHNASAALLIFLTKQTLYSLASRITNRYSAETVANVCIRGDALPEPRNSCENNPVGRDFSYFSLIIRYLA